MEGGGIDGVWWGRMGVILCGIFVLFHPLWCKIFFFVMKRFFCCFYPQKEGNEMGGWVVPEVKEKKGENPLESYWLALAYTKRPSPSPPFPPPPPLSSQEREEMERERLRRWQESYEKANQYYYDFRKKHPDVPLQPPPRVSFLSLFGFWEETPPPLRPRVCNWFYLLFWHLLSLFLSLLGVLLLAWEGERKGGWGGGLVVLSCCCTWGVNAGDLLITIFDPKKNLNGARRVDMLIFHHLSSIFLIPFLVFYCSVPLLQVGILSLLLESTGLLSILASIFNNPLFDLSTALSLLFLRGWCWSFFSLTLLNFPPLFSSPFISDLTTTFFNSITPILDTLRLLNPTTPYFLFASSPLYLSSPPPSFLVSNLMELSENNPTKIAGFLLFCVTPFNFFMITAWVKRASLSLSSFSLSPSSSHSLFLPRFFFSPWGVVMRGLIERELSSSFLSFSLLYLLPFLVGGARGGIWGVVGGVGLVIMIGGVGVGGLMVGRVAWEWGSRRGRKMIENASGLFWTKKIMKKKEFSKFEEVKWLLEQPSLSPLPHRYLFPTPFLLPFANWAKKMLLYNDFSHFRLKNEYPPLHQPKFVHENFGGFIRETTHSLFFSSLHSSLSEGGRGEVELMGTVCKKLPWVVMAHICGMEEKDIPEAAQLVTAMGEYVGRPSNPQLLRGAVKAHRKMIELIRRWKRKQQHRSPSSTCGVFWEWMKFHTFQTEDEFEANVVMILFAGTHNLENVLGHGIRLLLSHPEQLEKLRKNPKLLNNACEEIVRFCPPIRVLPRSALCDFVTPWGVRIKKGETILLRVADANRDFSIHRHPHVFNISRKASRKHLSFGGGGHFCRGNALGRLQLKVVLEEILLKRRFNICLSPLPSPPTAHWKNEETYAHLSSLTLLFSPLPLPHRPLALIYFPFRPKENESGIKRGKEEEGEGRRVVSEKEYGGMCREKGKGLGTELRKRGFDVVVCESEREVREQQRRREKGLGVGRAIKGTLTGFQLAIFFGYYPNQERMRQFYDMVGRNCFKVVHCLMDDNHNQYDEDAPPTTLSPTTPFRSKEEQVMMNSFFILKSSRMNLLWVDWPLSVAFPPSPSLSSNDLSSSPPLYSYLSTSLSESFLKSPPTWSWGVTQECGFFPCHSAFSSPPSPHTPSPSPSSSNLSLSSSLSSSVSSLSNLSASSSLLSPLSATSPSLPSHPTLLSSSFSLNSRSHSFSPSSPLRSPPLSRLSFDLLPPASSSRTPSPFSYVPPSFLPLSHSIACPSLESFVLLILLRMEVTWFSTELQDEQLFHPPQRQKLHSQQQKYYPKQQLLHHPTPSTTAVACPELLLKIAIECSLFHGARDSKSGNISFRLPSSCANEIIIGVSPRQVNKALLEPDQFCLVKHKIHQRSLLCYPSEAFPTIKSSIDSGVQAFLYHHLPWAHSMLHFHYSPHLLLSPSTTTSFPFPCGVEEEAVAILGAIQRKRIKSACMVELVHHGYVLIFSRSYTHEEVYDQWNQAYNSFPPSVSVPNDFAPSSSTSYPSSFPPPSSSFFPLSSPPSFDSAPSFSSPSSRPPFSGSFPLPSSHPPRSPLPSCSPSFPSPSFTSSPPFLSSSPSPSFSSPSFPPSSPSGQPPFSHSPSFPSSPSFLPPSPSFPLSSPSFPPSSPSFPPRSPSFPLSSLSFPPPSPPFPSSPSFPPSPSFPTSRQSFPLSSSPFPPPSSPSFPSSPPFPHSPSFVPSSLSYPPSSPCPPPSFPPSPNPSPSPLSLSPPPLSLSQSPPPIPLFHYPSLLSSPLPPANPTPQPAEENIFSTYPVFLGPEIVGALRVICCSRKENITLLLSISKRRLTKSEAQKISKIFYLYLKEKRQTEEEQEEEEQKQRQGIVGGNGGRRLRWATNSKKIRFLMISKYGCLPIFREGDRGRKRKEKQKKREEAKGGWGEELAFFEPPNLMLCKNASSSASHPLPHALRENEECPCLYCQVVG